MAPPEGRHTHLIIHFMIGTVVLDKVTLCLQTKICDLGCHDTLCDDVASSSLLPVFGLVLGITKDRKGLFILPLFTMSLI